MRISTKTSVALHILTALAVIKDERLTDDILEQDVTRSYIVVKDQKMTSEVLAKSSGSNSVVVRTILGKLKEAGMINVQRGTGGASLCIPASSISIWNVYQAVEDTPIKEIIGIHPAPSTTCPVGKYMKELLIESYDEILLTLTKSMQTVTLDQIVNNYFEKINPCPP